MNNLNFITILSFTVCLSCFCCSSTVTNKQVNLKYLSLSDATKIGREYERHIEVLYKGVDTEFVPDDRVKFNTLGLNKEDRIEFLEEYLNFYGNTSISNKNFSILYGRSHNRLEIVKKNIRYPIEVEALYSMTTFLFKDNIIISPVILNRKTGRICNFERKDINKVYEIYGEWLKKMKRNKSSKLSWPLIGSEYKWMGEDVVNDVEILLKPSI